MEFSPEDDCFAVRQAARYTSQMYDRHLANVGLTITQFSILCRLSRGRRLTMKQLADQMVMERTSLLRALRPLQRDRLVVSEALTLDHRALSLGLTATGIERLEAARFYWHAAQDEFEQRFGIQRSASLRRELLDMTGS
ncbi:MarR family transcriptional regulator [Paraburkholderia acidicola]|uniref:MarR family transcriptional regulator n=1 Tax=Paraburkholderia acidicola TaxID=1912599 RepID=A0A2A4EQV6_9BURK|nr:MarR family transcriptional regulator [Paraburkholderia acidicola]PCE23067.1 MarR family transcriptional regulator [Paraburkholderia acidicola]